MPEYMVQFPAVLLFLPSRLQEVLLQEVTALLVPVDTPAQEVLVLQVVEAMAAVAQAAEDNIYFSQV